MKTKISQAKTKTIRIFLAFFIAVYLVGNVSAKDLTLFIKPLQKVSICVYLEKGSGLHGGFVVQNGTVGFSIVDPNGLTLLSCDHTTNVTINLFDVSTAGNYSMYFMNPNSSKEVLLKLTFVTKSWYTIASLDFALSTAIPWWQIALAILLFIFFAFLKLAPEILKRILNSKVIIVKSQKYKGPRPPIAIKKLKAFRYSVRERRRTA